MPLSKSKLFGIFLLLLPVVASIPINITGIKRDIETTRQQITPAEANALQAHNTARNSAPGGTRPAMVWNSSLAASAQSWANHLAKIGQMTHSQGTGEGENLFESSGGTAPTLKNAVDAWVSEGANYHGEKIGVGNFAAYGHYTQVIWPETDQVGMASAKGATGYTYIVARYLPAGNYVGQTAWRPART